MQRETVRHVHPSHAIGHDLAFVTLIAPLLAVLVAIARHGPVQAVLSQQDPGLVKVAHVDDPCHPVYNNPFIRRRMRHKQRMLLYKREPRHTWLRGGYCL